MERRKYKTRSPSRQREVPKIGRKLIYLPLTRPEIVFAVSVVSQFMHSPPPQRYLNTINHILRFLKGNPCKGLLFRTANPRKIKCFVYADWAGSVEDRRSTIVYCTKVWENLVTWKSKKLFSVAKQC